MDAYKNIMDNLKAMGANPAITRDRNGNRVIKINAPEIPQERKPETETTKTKN